MSPFSRRPRVTHFMIYIYIRNRSQTNDSQSTLLFSKFLQGGIKIKRSFDGRHEIEVEPSETKKKYFFPFYFIYIPILYIEKHQGISLIKNKMKVFSTSAGDGQKRRSGTIRNRFDWNLCHHFRIRKSPSRYNWINWRIEDQFLFYFSCLIYQFI